ncbi:TBCC domain-containing protein 1 isoform X3 [Tachyglossus aculeatus]|uniref:TBCC domain-containing protein 1 isoform X2 n=1 Tax=Tachyglossus aculeatus TaxID=9261 RepID=UPI0018F5F016|nr:TBCC domain-containing protein 1 isoform X2 [Tachyglossus aculeatus]XP_038600514.1 TBCC domain-containing protein 1 isoform X3 [Tachyglossus aculeatus]
MDRVAVHLWVKPEPFIVGTPPLPPPPKLGPHYLRKVAGYVRARAGAGGYPRLSWATWQRVACGKLQLAPDLAWLYFETFDSLAPRSPGQRLEWAEAAAACASEDELDQRRKELSVDTLQFLLFLFIQQLNKISLRTSLIGEEWPCPKSKVQSPDLNGKSNCRNKNWDDSSHQEFVRNHLSDMLELLLDPAEPTGSRAHGGLVSAEGVRALSFLLEGTVSRARKIYPLHELALWPPLQADSGFSRRAEAFPLAKLEAWLRACLTGNPFGTSACLRSGKKLAWAQQVEGTTKRARVACNTRAVPKVPRLVVMSQVDKQTLAKSSDTLVGAHVRIHRCNESFIYLLSPLRSVTIEKCRNSTVVLGPVQTAVHLHGCDTVRVMAVCHRLSASATTDCTFHLLTPTRPLILAGNRGVTLAPFHTHYPMLEDHMGRTGLATLPNHWDRPLTLGRDGPGGFRLLAPADFYLFVVPFQMEGDTTEIPGGLPPAYRRALGRREQKIRIWQKMVKEAGLTKDERKQFQVLVENKFNEWLINTGHRQQLDSLVPPEAGSKQAAG